MRRVGAHLFRPLRHSAATLRAISSAAPAAAADAPSGLSRAELPPLAIDNFDEFSTTAPEPREATEDEHDAQIGAVIDELLDDLMLVRTDVLKNFARTRGVRSTNKATLVSSLLEHAKKEGLAPPQLKMTRRVLGETTANQLPSSPIRASWSNSSLEATMLEHACQRLVQGFAANFAGSVRAYSKQSSWISQRLLRMYQDSYKGTADAAVGGIYREYKHAADNLVASRKPSLIISAFSSFLCTRVSMAESPNLVGAADIGSRAVDRGIVQLGTQGEGLPMLERFMEMLDDVAAEVDRRTAAFAVGVAMNWGKESAATLRIFCDTVRRRHSSWDLEGVPVWVSTLVSQFSKWEALARNDVPELRAASATFFDAVLLSLAAMHGLSSLHPDVETNFVKDVPSAYRRFVYEELLRHYNGDEVLAHDALHKLGLYCRVERPEKARVTAELLSSIMQQMRAGLPDPGFRPPSQRLALVLAEMGLSVTRCERVCGTYRLLVQLTEDMLFHLRFTPIYEKMSAVERQRLRLGNVPMFKTLEFLERQGTAAAPPSTKSVAFLVTVLLYFSLQPSGSLPSVLTHLKSPTGREDLSVCVFTERERDTLSQLRVAYPPQLSHEAWLQSDASKGSALYKVVPAHAVKSSTSTVMLMSRAPIIKALDAISRVPWRVNKYMLHVQEAMVQEGYEFGKVRPSFYPLSYCRMRDGRIDTVTRPDGSQVELFNEVDSQSYDDRMDNDWRELQDTRSSRVHYLQALRQARALVNEPEIYFPNNMDFRGRMYPLPGRLNHTGSDPFRALLEHAKPKLLGREGLYWLKVHLANKMGQTKISFDDRATYVDDHIEDVVESARAPLKGDRWWQDADEPMQALMACKELSDAIEYPGGAHAFPSRLPVAVDGSYNGLQHYSAIGRDEHGAALVNLLPSAKPADAYTGILRVMMQSIVADAAADHEVAVRCLGSGRGLDKNHIKRKTIKRPIMTQVYGVTHFGMAKQIEEELQNQNRQHGLWLPAEIKEMSYYIRDKIMESLGVTFSQTQKCRQWLGTVGQLVWSCQPRDLKNAFMWTTPLGLIVRQPYREAGETNLFTPVGYTRISGAMLEPASRKQLSALAPNLIHSLDATHLAMTALEMQRQGYSMMAVHDSYWTHACDLPHLSRILREQFVDLYTNYDPLTELKEQWEEQFFLDLRRHGVRLPDPPQRGKLDLKEVLKSDYFFS
jgi:DNA-directed RNA polymerase